MNDGKVFGVLIASKNLRVNFVEITGPKIFEKIIINYKITQGKCT